MDSKFFRLYISLLLLIILIPEAISKDPAPVRDITLVQPDSVIKTAIWNAQPKRNIRLDRNYFWFYNNTICHNLGGYSGKLLHGKYEVFDKAKRLVCTGSFKYGLKEGEWIFWFTNGQIKEYIDYKKGKIQGVKKSYDISGNLVSEVRYRNNLPDGNSHYYQKDTIITKKYRKGIIENTNREKTHVFSFMKRYPEDPEKAKETTSKTKEKRKRKKDEDVPQK